MLGSRPSPVTSWVHGVSSVRGRLAFQFSPTPSAAAAGVMAADLSDSEAPFRARTGGRQAAVSAALLALFKKPVEVKRCCIP